MMFRPQGCHLYCTQPGITEESPNAPQTEHVSTNSDILPVLILNNKKLVFLSTAVTLDVSWFLQLFDRTTEETPVHREDVHYEGQHYQHLCYGKFVDSTHFHLVVWLLLFSY